MDLICSGRDADHISFPSGELRLMSSLRRLPSSSARFAVNAYDSGVVYKGWIYCGFIAPCVMLHLYDIFEVKAYSGIKTNQFGCVRASYISFVAFCGDAILSASTQD